MRQSMCESRCATLVAAAAPSVPGSRASGRGSPRARASSRGPGRSACAGSETWPYTHSIGKSPARPSKVTVLTPPCPMPQAPLPPSASRPRPRSHPRARRASTGLDSSGRSGERSLSTRSTNADNAPQPKASIGGEPSITNRCRFFAEAQSPGATQNEWTIDQVRTSASVIAVALSRQSVLNGWFSVTALSWVPPGLASRSPSEAFFTSLAMTLLALRQTLLPASGSASTVYPTPHPLPQYPPQASM